jgi:hypothetical protein
MVAICLVWFLPRVTPAPCGVTGGPFTDNKVEEVGKNAVHGHGVAGQLAVVPDDDAGKWQVLLFTGPACAPCNAIKAAFANNANLRSLAADDNSAWAHLNIYDSASESQKFRFTDYEVTQYPTLVVTTPVGTKLCPYVQVFRAEGYDGDADGLAQRMVEAITAFAAKYPPKPLTVSQQSQEAGAPWGNQPPCPCPGPCPQPYQNQFSLPNLPKVDVNVRPNEWPPRRQQQAEKPKDWLSENIENFFHHAWRLVVFLLGVAMFFAFWAVVILAAIWLVKRLFPRNPQQTPAAAGGVNQPAAWQAQAQPQWQQAPVATPAPQYPQASIVPATGPYAVSAGAEPQASYKPSAAALAAVQRAQAADADRQAAIKAANDELMRAAQAVGIELQAINEAATTLPKEVK